MKDEIVCKPSQLKDKVENFIYKNSLEQECFSVYSGNSKKELLTEDDF